MQVESRVSIQSQITQVTGAKSLNVKVSGARDSVKKSSPKRPISVAVQEKCSLSSIPLPQNSLDYYIDWLKSLSL